MCLATVYKEQDDSIILKNVSRDIMGEETIVEGQILMVDLANSIVKLVCTD